MNPVELLSRLNSSYWFVPLLVTLGGLALAGVLLWVDARVELAPDSIISPLYPSSAEGARALLSAIIGAMITATSVTFSMGIVALTVAAQHFGPRVLNNFVRHTSAQMVLGTFIATFIYSVLVLGSVQGTGATASVPQLAVLGSVILVIVSVGALIYYLHYVSSSIQVGELAAQIAQDFTGSVRRLHAGQERTSMPDDGPVPAPPADVAVLQSDASGYLQRIDYTAVVQLAAERDAVIWIQREPGSFVVAGTPLALVHPPAAADDEFVQKVNAACVVGRDRTLWHDAEFAVKQLVEVALRALSPGVNEPFTAMTCIDRLTEGLAEVLKAPEPRSCWRGADGSPRVFVEPQRFSTLLRAAFDPIRIFGGPNTAIYVRLLQAISALASIATRPDDRDQLRHQADVVRRAAEAALTDPDDRAFMEDHFRDAVSRFSARLDRRLAG